MSSTRIFPVQIVEQVNEENSFYDKKERSFDNHQATTSSIEQIDQLHNKVEDKLSNLREKYTDECLSHHNSIILDDLQ